MVASVSAGVGVGVGSTKPPVDPAHRMMEIITSIIGTPFRGDISAEMRIVRCSGARRYRGHR